MYRKSNKGWLKHIDFMIVDMISLEISFFLAYMIRHGFNSSLLARESYSRMVFVLLLIEFVSVALLRTFSRVLRRGYFDEFIATIKQVISVTLLSVLYLFSVQEGDDYSRMTLFLTGALYFSTSYISRCLWRKVLLNNKSMNPRSMIIITTEEDAPEVIRNYNEYNFSNVEITGIVITDYCRIGANIDGIPIVADLNTVEDYILSQWVDEVLLGIPLERDLSRKLHLMFLEMGITVHKSLIAMSDDSEVDRNIERVGGYTVITRSIRILTFGELFMKRVLDIVGAVIGCIITGILCIFVGPAIYIASPGPIFFSQERIGKNGKVFKMYKFRSMYLDAEERLKELKDQNQMDDDFMFKIENDPRIIGSEKGPGKGIGNRIRSTSIDEFPQFWNVLKGDMSLVGTRPPLISEWQIYKNHHRARMATKPGITGLWQISGRSNITDFEEIVDLDMEYIENWSFRLDIKILLKTVLEVFKREGAL